MADLSTGLFAYLKNTVLPGTPIFANTIPGSVRPPYVVYHILSTTGGHNLDGYAGATRTSVQIDAYGDPATDLAETLRQHLDGFAGQWSGVEVLGVFRVNLFSLPEPPADASDAWLRRMVSIYDCWHRESQPTLA